MSKKNVNKGFPNFLIIGATKSGTTSLYHYLKQHPKVYMSPVKEPHFFSYEGQQLNFNGPGDMDIVNQMIITDLNRYKSLFDGVMNEKAIGEASAMYIYIEGTAERIKRYIPDVKIIALLRNPVDRAYSSFMHLRRDGREPVKDFTQALLLEQERIKNNWMPIWHYKKMGFYYEQLKQFYDQFDKNRIRVYLFEELNNNPQQLLKNIFNFLEVDNSFQPDISLKHNISGIPRIQGLHNCLRRSTPMKTLIKNFIPERIRKNLITNILNLNIRYTDFLSPLEAKKLYDSYTKDIRKLQNLTSLDSSLWFIS